MPAEFTIVHRVQFSETDMAGIVHFANYFRWMEEVEHAFFRSVGMSVSMEHEGEHVSWPRVATACDFFAPCRFEDENTLRLRIMKVGGKSLNYEVDFLKGQTPVALGKMTSVCCTFGAGGMRSI
jgi:acyl-CoA thioester hydrolase